MTCYFEPDGRLSKINTENKEIVFSDNHQNISEFLADGSLKTTKYFQDSCIVSIESPSSERKVWYDKNGNVNSYHDDEKSLYFNELGMLTDYLLKIKD